MTLLLGLPLAERPLYTCRMPPHRCACPDRCPVKLHAGHGLGSVVPTDGAVRHGQARGQRSGRISTLALLRGEADNTRVRVHEREGLVPWRPRCPPQAGCMDRWMGGPVHDPSGQGLQTAQKRLCDIRRLGLGPGCPERVIPADARRLFEHAVEAAPKSARAKPACAR